ncbi:hypothetical protein GCM10027517_04360 [Phycicoccus ginsengisoli]
MPGNDMPRPRPVRRGLGGVLGRVAPARRAEDRAEDRAERARGHLPCRYVTHAFCARVVCPAVKVFMQPSSV